MGLQLPWWSFEEAPRAGFWSGMGRIIVLVRREGGILKMEKYVNSLLGHGKEASSGYGHFWDYFGPT